MSTELTPEQIAYNKRILASTDKRLAALSASGKFRFKTFTSFTLTEIAASRAGLKNLQKAYNEMCKSLGDGDFFVNCPQKLTKLGVVVVAEKHKELQVLHH